MKLFVLVAGFGLVFDVLCIILSIFINSQTFQESRLYVCMISSLMLNSLVVFGCTINCAKVELLKNKRRAGSIIVGIILCFERLSVTILFIPVIVMFFPMHK